MNLAEDQPQAKQDEGAADLLTVAQAAAELGMQPRSVRQAIEQGRLQAERFGPKATMLRRVEVERYRRTKRRPGRPRKDDATI